MQTSIPYGDDQIRVANGERARQVHRIRAAERVLAGELPGVPFNGGSEFHRASGIPEFFPGLLGGVEIVGLHGVVARGGGERSTDLGVGQSAGKSAIAAVPQLRHQVGPGFLHYQLDKRA